MEERGSQRRFTLEEQDLEVIRRVNEEEVILQGPDGELSLHYRNDDYAGAVVVIDGEGYEFVRSVSSIFLEGEDPDCPL